MKLNTSKLINQTGGRAMTNQQEEVELRKNLENIIITDDYVHGIQYKTLDNLVQFIEAHTNKAIGEVLDRLEPNCWSVAIEAERNKLKESSNEPTR